jgi:UDP-N-acetylglucosamine--N-acetylmuramyl-(pentapeptide) pyrophosphoryl-undecaprenol N-acetylglucosamine transferase
MMKIDPSLTIMFIGAKGKMEMEKVPQAGYKITGLDIAGFNRSSLIKNIGLPFKLIKSFFQVRTIFREFKPDAVIGVGGYSSFPVLKVAQSKGIPTFIHESNSYAGRSNKMLGRKARKIFTGTDGMESFFPAEKMIVTGNPVRSSISGSDIPRRAGIQFFSLDEAKKTILVIGGSQGARSINEAIKNGLDELTRQGLQLIWQTGRSYASIAAARSVENKNIWMSEFITEMEQAYAAADIIVSRSGAMSVAEICVAKKPVVFVPYPFAAEDHQTVNAMRLVNKKAALIVKESEAKDKLVTPIIELAKEETKQIEMKRNIAPLAITDADKRIADEILRVLNK